MLSNRERKKLNFRVPMRSLRYKALGKKAEEKIVTWSIFFLKKTQNLYLSTQYCSPRKKVIKQSLNNSVPHIVCKIFYEYFFTPRVWTGSSASGPWSRGCGWRACLQKHKFCNSNKLLKNITYGAPRPPWWPEWRRAWAHPLKFFKKIEEKFFKKMWETALDSPGSCQYVFAMSGAGSTLHIGRFPPSISSRMWV